MTDSLRSVASRIKSLSSKVGMMQTGNVGAGVRRRRSERRQIGKKGRATNEKDRRVQGEMDGPGEAQGNAKQ